MQITIGNDSFDIYPLKLGISVSKAAIYTIWTLNSDTQRYPLLYVGETGDLEERLDQNHHKYRCWLSHQISGLYLGVWLMPTAQFTKEQRQAEERRLINTHSPICNG